MEEVKTSGAFTPRAALWLSPALGGLLRDLSADEVAVLLGVLSCLSPNGAFLATPTRVAGALGIAPRQARRELERLCDRSWRDAPILLKHGAPSGLCFFVPSPHLLSVRRSVISPAPPPGERVRANDDWASVTGTGSPTGVSRREEVVAHSRSLYARPRAQVEADIEAFLDSGRAGRGFIKVRTPPIWDAAPEDAEQTLLPAQQGGEGNEEAVTSEARQWLALKRALVDVGVPYQRADELLALYPPGRIERQLAWLALRQARSPVAYLLAAIEQDYAPPKGAAPEGKAEPVEPAETGGDGGG